MRAQKWAWPVCTVHTHYCQMHHNKPCSGFVSNVMCVYPNMFVCMHIACRPRSEFGPTADVRCKVGTNCFSVTHPSLSETACKEVLWFFSCTKVEQNCDMNWSGGVGGTNMLQRKPCPNLCCVPKECAQLPRWADVHNAMQCVKVCINCLCYILHRLFHFTFSPLMCPKECAQLPTTQVGGCLQCNAMR